MAYFREASLPVLRHTVQELGRLRVSHVLSDQGVRATAHRFIRD